MRRRNPSIGAGAGLLILLLSIAGCSDSRERVVQTDISFSADGILEFIRADTVFSRIAIEIADTDSSQARGLMDRRSLPPRGGMLFVNTDVEERSFWMRSTPLPLDILFLDPDDGIINIVRHTVPYSEDYIRSDGPARHVLEVRSGFTTRNDIEPGISIRWRRVQKDAE